MIYTTSNETALPRFQRKQPPNGAPKPFPKPDPAYEPRQNGCTPPPCEECDVALGMWSTQSKDNFSDADMDWSVGNGLPHWQTNPDGTRRLDPPPPNWRDWMP
jgi:hypothetical protein